MRKILILLLVNLLIFTACRKEEVFPNCGTTLNINLSANDAFIFGSTGGFAGGGLGTYKMKNGQLFRILTNRDTLLSNDLFLQTQGLMTSFPKELKDNPNQNSQGGCADTFTYFAEIQYATGAKQFWYIDPCDNNKITPVAKCFIDEIGRLSAFLLNK